MKKYIVGLMVGLALGAGLLATLEAAEIGGGEKNPDLETNKQAIERWQDVLGPSFRG